MAAGGTLPNRFGRNDAKITRNLYPHRTLLAPRVRVVLDFLLGVMKSHAGLQAERADLQPFADRQPENGIRAEAHRVSGCLLSF